MAGKYGSASVTVTLDDAPGGTGRNITSQVLEIGGIKVVAGQQVSTAYGDSIVKMLPTGVNDLPPITIRCLFDTTATTGSYVVMGTPDDGPQDSTRTLVVVVGDSKTWTAEGYLTDSEVIVKVGALNEIVATFKANSGAWS